MIGTIILTTNDIQDRHAYVEDGKFYLSDDFDWKRFISPVLKIQIENGAIKDMYDQEKLAIDFSFTCLRRFNEYYGGSVQGFDPINLVFQGNCQEFPLQTPSIRNYLMDLIGWETTFDPDEPKPIDFWTKKTGNKKDNENNNNNPVVVTKINASQLFFQLGREFEKVGM